MQIWFLPRATSFWVFTAVSSTVSPPRYGSPRPKCHSHRLTSCTWLSCLPSASAVSDPLFMLNLCGIVGVGLPATWYTLLIWFECKQVHTNTSSYKYINHLMGYLAHNLSLRWSIYWSGALQGLDNFADSDWRKSACWSSRTGLLADTTSCGNRGCRCSIGLGDCVWNHLSFAIS